MHRVLKVLRINSRETLEQNAQQQVHHVYSCGPRDAEIHQVFSSCRHPSKFRTIMNGKRFERVKAQRLKHRVCVGLNKPGEVPSRLQTRAFSVS